MQKLNKGKSKLNERVKDGSYFDLVSEKESNTVHFPLLQTPVGLRDLVAITSKRL